MYVACCCCAAAAEVDLSSSAYPSSVLSLSRPRLIIPYLHLSPIAGIRGAAAVYDVPGCIQSGVAAAAAATAALCCNTATALCVAILLPLLLLADATRHLIQTAV